ncbi:hypothetical protein QM306_38640, partial [Burkholderia cenocepacia]|nr:hypothetical protein [Burkholderia cenocepacia]
MRAAFQQPWPSDWSRLAPLAQTFRRIGGTHAFTVAVNHLKSKNCPHASGANLDQSDGQGCWNAARTRAAAR